MRDLPPEVVPLLDELTVGIRNALGENLVGMYLSGSLALGGFDPKTSDVDMVVVTERAVSDPEFGALAGVHERVPPIGNDFGQEYEVFYIDREAMRRWAMGRHLRVEPDAALHWEAQRSNFVIERWVLRERGVTLFGPDPKTLIEPVSPDDICEAVRAELSGRLEWWMDGTWPPEELWHRGAQAYEIETVCRALYTLQMGELPSKREAIDWGMRTLPEEWRPLLEWSRRNKKDRTQDTSRVDGVLAFVRWAAAKTEPV